MLDDGIGFSLVPWRPVIDQNLGRSITGILHGGSTTWELGQGRGRSIA
jgi:hypothetical protein